MTPGATITAVVFDYGGVLTEPPFEGFRVIAEEAGAPLEEVLGMFVTDYESEGASAHPWHRLERGEISLAALDGWGREYGRDRGWNLRLSRLVELISNLAIRPEMLALVRSLRREGYRTALVTNNARELDPIWRAQMPVDELFDVVIASCDVGLRKPDKRIYQLVLERLGGLEPHRAAMVDDMDANLLGAAALGMHTIRVGVDPAEAIAELSRLLSPGEADR